MSLDTDFQHPPAVIPELVARWHAGADVVQKIHDDDARLGRFKRWTLQASYALLAR